MMTRQGDVLIYSIDRVPAHAKLLQEGSNDKPIVLAHGEVTGHTHSIRKPSATRYFTDLQSEVKAFLDAPAPVEIEHEEHAPVSLPAGKYAVVIQKEYVPSDEIERSWRVVGD